MSTENVVASPQQLPRTFFNPVSYQKNEWDFKNAVDAKDKHDLLSIIGTLSKILGIVGSIIATCQVGAILFFGSVLTLTPPLILIASVALYALGKYFGHIADKHIEGLSEEKMTELALQQLIEDFRKLPVFRSEEALQAELEQRREIIADVGIKATQQANSLVRLAHPLYRPFKEYQAKFMIYSERLSRQQVQDLLDVAYEKGIILQFSQLKHDARFDRKQLTYAMGYSLKDDFGAQCFESMHLGFNIAWEFLLHRYKERAEKNIHFDVPFINGQLKALGFEWAAKKETRTLNPTLQIREGGVLEIRGNCSDIPDPAVAIKALSRYVKYFEIYRFGIACISPKIKTETGSETLCLNNDDDWHRYQTYLKTLIPPGGDIVFFEGEKEQNQQIWQSEIKTEEINWDEVKDVFEDHKRVQAIRNA